MWRKLIFMVTLSAALLTGCTAEREGAHRTMNFEGIVCASGHRDVLFAVIDEQLWHYGPVTEHSPLVHVDRIERYWIRLDLADGLRISEVRRISDTGDRIFPVANGSIVVVSRGVIRYAEVVPREVTSPDVVPRAEQIVDGKAIFSSDRLSFLAIVSGPTVVCGSASRSGTEGVQRESVDAILRHFNDDRPLLVDGYVASLVANGTAFRFEADALETPAPTVRHDVSTNAGFIFATPSGPVFAEIAGNEPDSSMLMLPGPKGPSRIALPCGAFRATPNQTAVSTDGSAFYIAYVDSGGELRVVSIDGEGGIARSLWCALTAELSRTPIK